MSLDVFLSFRRCPKHPTPNTPPFDFGPPIAYFGNLLPIGGYLGGDFNEIYLRFRGAKVE
jgi:hypothetical protein